jgi:hypothetical protein
MPAITKPNLHFDATLYTGNGTAQSITNAGGFQPDLVWGKDRTNIANHGVIDVNRGISNWLGPNATNVEGVVGGSYVTAFNSNGFTVGTGGVYNASGDNYVAWQWKAGGTAVTNTSGTISSQVSVNTTAGFSIVTYTGNGITTATVGHGLGAAPSMIIVKARSATSDWIVRHSSLAAGYQLRLNSTIVAEQISSATNAGGLGSGTSSVINFLAGNVNTDNVNLSGGTFVAYCWTPIAGYSAFGSYTGNGSTDGPFIYTGFRPKFVFAKRTTGSAGSWNMVDGSRSPYNVAVPILYADLSDADYTGYNFGDLNSNGFKLRSTTAANASGDTYIYMAFAEAPFKYSSAK